uniref:Major capsid protein N-terminal domain-containing protein n=1 Tax=viral metagenome TaxID=1070528 RepID=A0A6C0H8M6_9ZZZZ
MGLGLLILVSIGKENIYLTTEPEITFFKLAYKKYTNFSIEAIPQYFQTTPDFGRKCTINIGKTGDLMYITYLYIELPPIDSSINFKWVNKIGLALINYIEIEIEGNIIDRHYGDWLNIWYEMTTKYNQVKGYNNMIGNIKNLTEYSKTKLSYILYIPLAFWYCLDSGIALPLISLSNSDIKIHVEFNNFNTCYNISPSYYITINESICCFEQYEKMYQYYQNQTVIGQFIKFDPITQRVYYNPIQGIFKPIYFITNYNNDLPITMQTNSVIVQTNTDFNYNYPSLLNAYLLVNYIYLDNYERVKFINNSPEYIIQVIQTLQEQIIYSANNIYKLGLYNPIKLLVWRGILLSNLNNNDMFNYSDKLINKNLVVINSINRMDIDSIPYYTMIPIYQYNFNNMQQGIYVYSFALNPLELQPSGSLNFSKIDDAYIQLTMNKTINYQNPVNMKCYAIQYNIFKINNGIGGIVYNN